PRAKAARQEPRPPDAPRPAAGRMFVAGRVLDPDGKPVPNATVMVHAAPRRPGHVGEYEELRPSPIGRAQCDGSGRFRLDAMRTTSSLNYRVGAVAMAPGFGAGWAELDPDADEPATDITLKREQEIRGRLLDREGRPARGVRVEVHSMGRPDPT